MTGNKSTNVWLRSPAWDGFWIQSGLWLLIPVLGLADLPNAAQWLLIVAVLLLWLPHRFATAYNAFCTPAYQHLIRVQWIRFCAAPIAIFAATFLFVFGPESVVPWDLIARVQILATIFFLYNSYHFAAQHFGVLSIYRIRASQPQDPSRKRLEKAVLRHRGSGYWWQWHLDLSRSLWSSRIPSSTTVVPRDFAPRRTDHVAR